MNYKIPLFDLNFDSAEENAVLDVLRSKWISTGPRTSEFETMFTAMLGAEHALALANCTVALHLAMTLANVENEDEVICPSLTFVATVNAIRYTGGVPVFADIKSVIDPTIDPADIEAKITDKTKAIVVMHYGGFACDMDSIMNLAKKYGLTVIEDACHAPLSEYKGKKLGTIGDIGCFSFFSNKNISTGEGGMLVTNDRSLFDRAKLLRSHGMTSMSYERAKGHSTEYDVVDLGFNYRMDDIRAAIGIVQLRKLPEDLAKRGIVRRRYLECLADIENVIIPFADYAEFASNYVFPVVINGASKELRDEIRHNLATNGIQTSVHYPAVHRFSIYREYYSNLPRTDHFAESMITLPMYSRLSMREIQFITSTLRSFV